MADSGADLLETVSSLLTKVSRGPWRAHPDGEVMGPEGHSIAECWGPECGEDAELIARAPEWLVALVTEVRRLRGALSLITADLCKRFPETRPCGDADSLCPHCEALAALGSPGATPPEEKK